MRHVSSITVTCAAWIEGEVNPRDLGCHVREMMCGVCDVVCKMQWVGVMNDDVCYP